MMASRVKNKEKISYLSVVMMGIAILIKSIAILFIPAMLVYLIYFLINLFPGLYSGDGAEQVHLDVVLVS